MNLVMHVLQLICIKKKYILKLFLVNGIVNRLIQNLEDKECLKDVFIFLKNQ